MARAMQLTHRWLAALVAGVLVWGVLSADAAGSGAASRGGDRA